MGAYILLFVRDLTQRKQKKEGGQQDQRETTAKQSKKAEGLGSCQVMRGGSSEGLARTMESFEALIMKFHNNWNKRKTIKTLSKSSHAPKSESPSMKQRQNAK